MLSQTKKQLYISDLPCNVDENFFKFILFPEYVEIKEIIFKKNMNLKIYFCNI